MAKAFIGVVLHDKFLRLQQMSEEKFNELTDRFPKTRQFLDHYRTSDQKWIQPDQIALVQEAFELSQCLAADFENVSTDTFLQSFQSWVDYFLNGEGAYPNEEKSTALLAERVSILKNDFDKANELNYVANIERLAQTLRHLNQII